MANSLRPLTQLPSDIRALIHRSLDASEIEQEKIVGELRLPNGTLTPVAQQFQAIRPDLFRCLFPQLTVLEETLSKHTNQTNRGETEPVPGLKRPSSDTSEQEKTTAVPTEPERRVARHYGKDFESRAIAREKEEAVRVDSAQAAQHQQESSVPPAITNQPYIPYPHTPNAPNPQPPYVRPTGKYAWLADTLYGDLW